MAYFSFNSVELLLRASARCFAPSASMLFKSKLQTRIDQTRQRALTVGGEIRRRTSASTAP